ncbi:anti-sigma factor [Thermosulfurimonas sp. F29]|uniref:anti-sigma factor family protein n=1 Tax=Thermosulfurimonas sp. F29 TaxID=2867247 RepID=UPI001C8384C3|nr:zf-HC2 domain-containing protein [Thermosulfurimonas sp. F29]MBX6423521.1 hypothetical protein [Thermosulfurimonas sp. F29]
MMCSREKDDLRALIPLYLAGSLPKEERKRLEEALAGDPELQRELEGWRLLKEAYGDLARTLPGPSSDLYAEIRRRTRGGFGGRVRIFLRRRWRHSWQAVIIVLQLLIIILLGIHSLRSPRYYTLSSPVCSEKGYRINIVFRQNATEGEIRKLLLSQGARIVDGPYPSGLYVITVPPGEARQALTVFRKSPLVIMAERAS